MLASGHWTESHAKRLLAAHARSGLSLAAFARSEGVRARRLQWWKDRLAARATMTKESAKRAAATFAPAIVKLAPRVRLSREAMVVITTRSGATVEIADATRVPPTWVGAVLHELERAR